MANPFIGLHMQVILRDPIGYVLTGTVRDVEAGASLTLTNVFVKGTKDWHPQMRIDAANIADLSEIKHDESPTTYPTPPVPQVPPEAPSKPPSQPAFVDPAILSLGRRPVSGAPSASDGKVSTPGSQPQVGQPGVLPTIHLAGNQNVRNTPQELAASMNGLKVDSQPHELGDAQSVETVESQLQKKKRRQRQAKQARAQRSEEQGQPAEATQALQGGGRGKGWRQTPMLQSTSSFQPFLALKRQGKGRKGDLDNGWASEDVTEGMGEFDFENNLAKFDKRTIFDQMRKEDEVDDASRLVAYNRRPKPGTAGGKNLHYTENVLDKPAATSKGADFWNSEADDGVNGAERPSGRDLLSGQSTRRADSKSGISRKIQSRKASTVGVVGGQPLNRLHLSHRSISRPESRSTDDKRQQNQPPGLYLKPSNRRLETVSALQMLNLENIAANEIGLTEELMAENAGRGLAQVALTALNDPAIKVRFGMASATGAVTPATSALNNPTIVIMAGNNKSGIRSLAASRHLRNKNINVLVCLVGIERERDLLEDLRQQIQLYRNFGGKIFSKNELFEHLRKNTTTGAPVSISLIIDALLGLTISFEELRTGDQATVYELMEWANRNEAFVLAVDVPTGVDPSTGKIAVIDGGRLFVKPRYVVAMGAPKRGLLEAVTPPSDDDDDPESAAHEDEWRLYIADIGLGSAVWRKAGTKIRRGIDFDDKWVLEMQYRDGSTDSEEED